MNTYLVCKKEGFAFRSVTLFTTIAFVMSLVLVPAQSLQAQSVPGLPAPGTLVTPSIGYTPAIMTGVAIDPQNPLKFDFIIDTGDENLQGDALNAESARLINYFMASLTVPQDEMWVNLSPYEDNRIIADGLGQTEMGRDMLAQDYILKQLMASLMYPEDELGQKFWERVHKKSLEQYGTTDIPVNTFNKIWIVPDKASVYTKGTSAFVVESHLKVILEKDYVAAHHNRFDSSRSDVSDAGSREDETQDVSEDIIREILIPEIEKEVNEGKNFSNLRQIFHSMILATWFKQSLKKSLLGGAYVNKNKVEGIDLEDKSVKEKIYNQYIEAYKKGVYNFIKEDYDPVRKEMIPRKYFSGGIEGVQSVGEIPAPVAWVAVQASRTHVIATAELEAVSAQDADTAMTSEFADSLVADHGFDVSLGNHEFDGVYVNATLAAHEYTENPPLDNRNNSFRILHGRQGRFVQLGEFAIADERLRDIVPTDLQPRVVFLDEIFDQFDYRNGLDYTLPYLAQMVLERDRFQDATVLELGLGGGIAALLAVKLGAKKVIGVEIDPKMKAIVEKSNSLNGVEDGQIVFVEGGFGDEWMPTQLAEYGPFDIVLAHIGPHDIYSPGYLAVMLPEAKTPSYDAYLEALDLVIRLQQDEDALGDFLYIGAGFDKEFAGGQLVADYPFDTEEMILNRFFTPGEFRKVIFRSHLYPGQPERYNLFHSYRVEVAPRSDAAMVGEAATVYFKGGQVDLRANTVGEALEKASRSPEAAGLPWDQIRAGTVSIDVFLGSTLLNVNGDPFGDRTPLSMAGNNNIDIVVDRTSTPAVQKPQRRHQTEKERELEVKADFMAWARTQFKDVLPQQILEYSILLSDDSELIASMVDHLSANAYDAIWTRAQKQKEPGYIGRIDIRVTLTDKGYLKVTLTDNGIGIGEDTLKDLGRKIIPSPKAGVDMLEEERRIFGRSGVDFWEVSDTLGAERNDVTITLRTSNAAGHRLNMVFRPSERKHNVFEPVNYEDGLTAQGTRVELEFIPGGAAKRLRAAEGEDVVYETTRMVDFSPADATMVGGGDECHNISRITDSGFGFKHA